MKINTVKQRLFEGQPSIGIVSVLGSPLVAEALAGAGFDFVLIDNQHGFWHDESTWLAFRTMNDSPAVPMARVQQNNFGAIGRLLDRGAMGLVIPMVESAEQAQAAARAARYPPRGSRSFGPFLAEYHGKDYAEKIEDELLVAVQIESATAADQAEAILSVDGVDGCWVGPLDLVKTLGIDLNTAQGRQAHEQALFKVLTACKKTGKIPGIHALSPEDARHRIEQGFLFVTVGVETALLQTGARAVLKQTGRLT